MDEHRSPAAPYWKGDLFILDGMAYADFIPHNRLESEIRPLCLGSLADLAPALAGEPDANVRPLARRLLSRLHVPAEPESRHAVARGGPAERPKMRPNRPEQGILPL